MSSRPITKNILSYIENHLDDELSLEKIAEELNYSRFYIARVFRENTGLTLYRYIRGRRLNESARKLTETKLLSLRSLIWQDIIHSRHLHRLFTGSTIVRRRNTGESASLYPDGIKLRCA
jgi:AraC-like DNA-binding protein